MANWTRVWDKSAGTTGACGSCICMPVYGDVSHGNATVFTGLLTSITTVGEAINYWAEQLRRRLDCRTALVATLAANSSYQVVLGHATVTWTLSSSLGALPLVATYTVPSGTGSAQFDTVSAALDWLVECLA
jgi:hypothetical protein